MLHASDTWPLTKPPTSATELPDRSAMSGRKMLSPPGPMSYLRNLALRILFVCVEVLRPSKPNGVMSSTVSLPNHMFTGQA